MGKLDVLGELAVHSHCFFLLFNHADKTVLETSCIDRFRFLVVISRELRSPVISLNCCFLLLVEIEGVVLLLGEAIVAQCVHAWVLQNLLQALLCTHRCRAYARVCSLGL